MKKIVLILGLFFSLCSNARAQDNANEQEFVNPIFYQPLQPLGRTSTWTYLTPISIKSMTPLDKNKVAMTGECELVENEQNHITLLCDIFWHNPEEKGKKSIITYSIKGLSYEGCLRIEEAYRSLNEEYPSIYNYCVTPLNYIPSESD